MITKQFIRFVIIGIYSTIINYGIFYILYKFFNIHYIYASAIGFIIGVLAGYAFNKNWTFNASKDSKNFYLFKYYIVYLVSLVSSLGILKLAVTKFGIPPVIANIGVIGFTTCVNFVGTKFLVFKT